MALSPLVATQPSFNIRQSNAAILPFVTQDATGANIDVTGWFAWKFDIHMPGGNGAMTDFLVATPTPAGGAGACTVSVTATQAAALPPGTLEYVFSGKVLTGDDYQVIATGNLQVGIAL